MTLKEGRYPEYPLFNNEDNDFQLFNAVVIGDFYFISVLFKNNTGYWHFKDSARIIAKDLVRRFNNKL